MSETPAPHGPTAPRTPRRGRPPSGGREAVLAAALELLRERGASKLTTREVASRAGVSEGSVFYHFTDRTGLLTAAIEDGLQALKSMQRNGIGRVGEPSEDRDGDVRAALERFSAAVEIFLDRALVVMIAAQSDAELRAGLADYLLGNDLGPHRGIQHLGEYLREQQAAGTIRTDVDPQAIAFFVVSSCFLRVSQRQMISDAYGLDLPGRTALMDTLMALITPGIQG